MSEPTCEECQAPLNDPNGRYDLFGCWYCHSCFTEHVEYHFGTSEEYFAIWDRVTGNRIDHVNWAKEGF